MTSTPTSATEPSLKPRDRYWRSLSELHESKEFNQFLHREFPVAASEYPEGVSRRRWLQLMAASMSVAGAVGCRYPTETIAPFVIRPEGRIPGETYGRSSSFELAGRAYNLLVTNVDGRPIKIEGNSNHPSGGGTDAYVQASILGLYDPDRARGDDGAVLRREGGDVEAVQWADAISFATGLVKTAASSRGKTFALLMSPTQSPSVVRLVKALRERLPEMTLCRHDGVHGDAMRVATKTAIGTASRPLWALDQAKVILSFESDFLCTDTNGVRNSRTFAATRDPDQEMSRLYVVEGGYTNTGVAADTRLAMRPSQMAAMISEVERRIDRLIGGEVAVAVEDDKTPFDELDPQARVDRFLSVVCQELKDAGEAAVVIVGEALGADAIAAGIRLNSKLGSLGTIQRFLPMIDDELGDAVSLADLTKATNAGRVESLVILGDNPGFTAAGDVKLLDAIASVENTLYIGEYDDETAAKCRYSLPLAHPLESWGDCIGSEGLYGVCQPQILPLLGGRSVIELLAVMLGEDEIQGRDIVRRTADAVAEKSLSEREWRKLLHDGFDESIALEIEQPQYQGSPNLLTDAAPVVSTDVDRDDIDLLFVPADGIYDGRFANNGWLQEMPQSLTKLTWDNAAVMGPRTARELAVRDGSMVVLRRGDVSLELPVFVMPGLAPGVVTVSIGYGRTRAGMVGGMVSEDVPVVGFDVSALRQSDSPMWARQIEGRPRYNDYTLACTQDHWAIDDLGRIETERRSRQLIREGTTALLEKNEHFASDKGPHVPHVGKTGSPWTEPMEEIETETMPQLPQWGMSIDLNKCFGCNACVVACQSENNVPIVGKEQVINSREMHWLRLDRYFQGNEDHANVVTQPMLCQHCETAPCEQVCPVAATVHTDDGINAMAYNRCIGTRYCANNCPFKVRRFNYFNYNTEVGVGYGIDAFPGTIEKANRKLQQLVLNPDVTVRGRGVMEKCTFCIQRVEQGKIAARREDRAIRDGDVKTACQMACPSGAIEFGNIKDANAVVTKKQHDRRAYGMLSQLNVKPRTVYLAKIRNTHPRLMTAIQLADLQEYGTPKHHGDEHHSDEHGGGSHGDDAHALPQVQENEAS